MYFYPVLHSDNCVSYLRTKIQYRILMNTPTPHIVIIGAGAAGCFAAVEVKRCLPHARVTVCEGKGKALAKVAVTGGGRCNLTNSFADVRSIETVYPRGARLMKRLFKQFNHKDVYAWFEQHGIPLVTQPDRCVFPRSQKAMDIVNKLLYLMKGSGVQLLLNHKVQRIVPLSTSEGADHAVENYGDTVENAGPDARQPRYRIEFALQPDATLLADYVLVTTGGSPRLSGLDMLRPLALELETPVPSLFGLSLPDHPLTQMTGTVVEDAVVGLVKTKIKTRGPLLITHRGLSGPAILKLSAHGARILAEQDYHADIVVNWLGDDTEQDALNYLNETAMENPQKQLQNIYPEQLNSRLWHYLLTAAGVRPETRWAELGRKGYNRLAVHLTAHPLHVEGRDAFKEEFVTCGGVALGNVDSNTLECRRHPGLYLAGEVLDVDAVTGGFNLQAAWTMGYVAAHAIGHQEGCE